MQEASILDHDRTEEKLNNTLPAEQVHQVLDDKKWARIECFDIRTKRNRA